MPAIPIAVYGPSGIGKTADITRCFRNAFYLMYDFDGLASCRTLWGFSPRAHSMTNLDQPTEEAVQTIRSLASAVKQRQVSAVVIDTGTELALRIHSTCDERYGGDPRRVFPAVKREVTKVVREAINLDVPIVVIFQNAEPRKKSQTMGAKMGGPQLPGTTLEDIRPMFSVILRADYIAGAQGKERCYICDPFDGDWVTKDRYNVCEKVQPMDIRPIMARIVKTQG